MNKRESIDVESAYGSEISSNSGFSTKKETFTFEEPTAEQQVWHKWLKYKLREYMVLEAILFMILVFILVLCYRITSQNQEILNLQSQFNSFQKQTTGKKFTNLKNETEEVIEKENEKMKEILGEVLKEVKIKSVVHEVSTRPYTNYATNSERSHSLTKPTASPFNITSMRFNAASFIAGATIDTPLSSSSNLNPTFRFDQNEAPKIYDVVGCLDYYCEQWEPLASNCTYRSLLSNIQEQICQITRNISSPIGKLQFRFRKNQGNTERTCVSLVRVYAETEEVPEQKLRSLEDTKTCLDLKHNYHHNPFTYSKFDYKNCTVLYSKGCCTECPECCEECDINDINEKQTTVVIAVLVSVPSFIILFALMIYCMYLCDKYDL